MLHCFANGFHLSFFVICKGVVCLKVEYTGFNNFVKTLAADESPFGRHFYLLREPCQIFTVFLCNGN